MNTIDTVKNTLNDLKMYQQNQKTPKKYFHRHWKKLS
jgi:hypothetical protein